MNICFVPKSQVALHLYKITNYTYEQKKIYIVHAYWVSFFSPHRVDELLSAVSCDTVQMCEVGTQEGNTVQCVLAQWAADSRLNCMLVNHMTP